MKKFASIALLGCVALCSGVLSLSQESIKSLESTSPAVKRGELSKCPIEQVKTSIKVKLDGVYEVGYTMRILQKGLTTVSAKPGLIIDHHKKETGHLGKPDFFRLSPQNYVFDGISKHHETLSHCSGKALLRLTRGDFVRIGLVTVPITPLYPQPIVKDSTLSLRITPFQ